MEGTETRKIAYWTIVWNQFKKNRLALFGLGCISILVLLAIFAPILASNKPFFLTVDGKTTYPWFDSLFDRNFFENGVDIFFNLLMLMTPLFVINLFLPRKVRKTCFIILMVLFFITFFLLEGWLSYTRPVVDYKKIIQELTSEGKSIKYLFPYFQYFYSETEIQGVSNPQPISKKHWLGTDKEGRDVFTRMLYGTRISLTIGVVAVAIEVLIGIIIGATAGYFGGKIDIMLSRLIEIMMCFPTFFLILTLASFVEKRSIFHIMFIIGITGWTGVARLTRGEVLKQKTIDYVQAAIALGISRTKIIFSHILPNAIAPVLVSATFGVAAAILTESSLSFLGLGDVSAPSWGQILSVGRTEQKLWLILSPGLAIFFVVTIFNLVGEGLRDAMDPKLRQ